MLAIVHNAIRQVSQNQAHRITRADTQQSGEYRVLRSMRKGKKHLQWTLRSVCP